MTSTPAVAAAALAWLVVLLGPAVVVSGRSWRTRWDLTLGAGPLLTLAVLGLLRGSGEFIGGTAHPLTVLMALAAASLAARMVVRRLDVASGPAAGPPCALVCVVAASLSVWFVLSTSGQLTLGGIDGPRHAYFVDRIVETSDPSAASVLRHDPDVDEAISGYYPLAVHVGTATVQRATGLGTADVLNGLGLVLCGLVLPCGWAALGRRLLSGTGAVVAAGAAAFGSLWPWFGWSLGWMPYVTGLALLPGALAVVDRGVGDRRTWPLVAVAAAAMSVTHPGAMCVFVVACGAVAATTRQRTGRLVVGALAGLVAVAPEVWAMVTGMLERTEVTSPTIGLSVAEVAGWGIGRFRGSAVSVPLMAAAAAGAVVGGARCRRFSLVPVALCGLAVAVAGHDEGVVHLLAAPWNADVERLVLTGYALAPVLAASTLVWVAGIVARHRRWLLVASTAVTVGMAALATSSALDGARYLSRTPSRATQLVMEQAATAGPGRILAGYPFDGGLWLSTLDGLVPAFGWPPEFVDTPASWRQRQQLAALVADPASDPLEVSDLAARLCVGSVLVVDGVVSADPGYPFDRNRMRTAPFLREVVTGDDASVFAISGDRAGRCEAT